MDSGRTTTRQYSEYSDFFQHNKNESTIEMQTSLSGSPLRSDGVDETGDANRTLVWVTRRTTGRDGQTTIGSIRTHSLRRWNSRRATNAEREVGQPSIGYLKTVVHRDSRWDIPWKHALFTSEGPDNTTSGSDIPESHADRPPEVEYSERLISRRPQDKGVTEGSMNMQLEMAGGRLQKDVDDWRGSILRRSPSGLRGSRDSRRRQFQDTPESRTGSSTMRCLKPFYVRMVGTMSRQPYSCFLIWTEMHSTSLC